MGYRGKQCQNNVFGQTGRTKPFSLQLTKYFTRNFNRPRQFSLDLSYTVSQYRMTLDLTSVRQEVNCLEGSALAKEVELAINLDLYGLL